MFEGAYNPIYSNSMADFGARRILGTRSLMNYINTGNATTGAFLRNKQFGDRFCSSKPKNRFDKLITFLTLTATLVASLTYLNKKCKINTDFLKSVAGKFKPDLSKVNIKNGFVSLKDKLFSKLKNKTSDGANVIYNDIHNFASRAGKKAKNAGNAKEFFEQIKNKV